MTLFAAHAAYNVGVGATIVTVIVVVVYIVAVMVVFPDTVDTLVKGIRTVAAIVVDVVVVVVVAVDVTTGIATVVVRIVDAVYVLVMVVTASTLAPHVFAMGYLGELNCLFPPTTGNATLAMARSSRSLPSFGDLPFMARGVSSLSSTRFCLGTKPTTEANGVNPADVGTVLAAGVEVVVVETIIVDVMVLVDVSVRVVCEMTV